ncbi:hypothetical protein BC938DRAFT_480930 [Jimgerdemannia flammicorona]|uniref:Endo-1,3(4)-beta-glucanase 1 carbohydrate binding domain-containing protein n=1 Tax=Jimgerdemannia flammicorona TaxID=994334 RepID=A0A433QI28_9FUNG|nr:hypothetical protein BC938DRAFT_480930 [Jimgerdemannia flammicorona]
MRFTTTSIAKVLLVLGLTVALSNSLPAEHEDDDYDDYDEHDKSLPRCPPPDGVPYDPSQYKCHYGFLCPVTTEQCGQHCYFTNAYTCTDGHLCPIGTWWYHGHCKKSHH